MTSESPGWGRANQDLEQVLDSLPGVVFIYELTPEGQDGFRFLSARAAEWLGVDLNAAHIDAGVIWDRIHPEDRTALLQARAETRRPARPYTAEFRVRDGQGRERWLSVMSTPAPVGADGKLTFHGMAQDVTEAHRARAVRDTQHAVLEHIATGASLPTVLDEVCRMLEVHVEGSLATLVLLDRATQTIHFGAAPTMDPAYMEALEGLKIGPEAGTCGTALYFGSQVISSDLGRDPKWVNYLPLAQKFGLAACWSTPFFASDGQPAGTFAVYSRTPRHPDAASLELSATCAQMAGIAFQHDAAQRGLREAEAQLHRAQKMEALGQLAGGIAHDFNNILTVIHGTSSLLEDSLPESSPEREDAMVITSSAERAALLTQRLLAFGRRQAWAPRSVHLSMALENLKTLLGRTLGDQINLHLEVDTNLPTLWIDVGQLEQILVNLTVNARDAMPNGGRIDVRAQAIRDGSEDAPTAVRIEVQDNGEGISAETLEHIFEPFFTTKAPGHGTGLGLAVVYAVIERAGGTVEAHSSPGLGTCFTIILPAEQRGQTPRPPRGPSARRGAQAPAKPGERVLIVEDEPPVRALTARILRGLGYEVEEAEHAQSALEALEAVGGRFNLVFSDVVMPGMQGTELARQIRLLYPTLPVLLTSAHSDNLVIRQDILPQGQRLLSKPFSPTQLAQWVREVIDRVDGEPTSLTSDLAK